MFKLSSSEKRSILEALLIFFVALALIFIYQTATEPLLIARQNHILGIVATGLAALGVLIARLQMR